MRFNYLKTSLKKAVLVTTVLLLGVALTVAQQTINLTAGPTTLLLPDGSTVPMWGYTCGTAVTGSTATCAALNPNAPPAVGTTPAGWSPVVITVPYVSTGTSLTINLTNNLSFTPTTPAGAPANTVPTSLMIVGQVGGGLGNVLQRTTTPSPTHASQAVTWSTVGSAPLFTPPPQGPRVQSFGTEVPAGATSGTGTIPALTWTALRPGTYLLESGTHPSIQVPMGLYGILVVTAAPAGTTAGCAYPGAAAGTCAVAYNAEIPLEFSEIDPVQNNAVNTAVNTVGFNETEVWTRHGASGPVTSIAVTNGGSLYTLPPTVTINGIGSNATAVATLTGGVVTAITITNAGDGYSSAAGSTTVTITPAAGDTTGTGATATATVTTGGCGGGAHTCYPPAVDYTPLYYMINGVAFNKTNASISLFAASPATGVTGNVLARLVNAGVRMHVPSIVGSQTTQPVGTGSVVANGFSILAEDGNVAPGVPKVQSDIFMSAGKTFDVMINVPTSATAPALPVYDRELSLSGNATERDAGMLAYIGINGAGLPAATGAFATPVARPDIYNSVVPGETLTVSDPSKGVIANDTNVYGVHLLTPPTGGTVTLNVNGTFTYVPNSGTTSDTFTYCANGSVTGTTCSSGLTALVTLGAATIEASSGITCSSITYNASTSVYLAIKTPGVLAACKDAAGYPLTLATTSISAPAGLTVRADANGGFTATAATACTTATGCSYSFTFQAQNSQGTLGAATTATVLFPAGSGLAVTVLDGTDKTTQITDYRWMIEEDRTFYIDPKCTSNPPPATCPTVSIPGQGVSGIVPTLGTNFHTSYMPYVAQGCTGQQSCEGGQTVLDTGVACTSPNVPAGCSPTAGQHITAVCDIGNGVCRPDPTASGSTWVNPSQVALDPTKRYYITAFPGDAANPFYGASANGHGMGGAPIAAGQTAVTVLTQPSPYPPAKLSVFVFEDDFPLNGEQDGGGGIDILSPNEPGLGQFQIHLWDAMGGNGDFTGQMTYDFFNQPLSNSLAGTIDPVTQIDACPISTNSRQSTTDPTQTGITGMIVTCPKYESDGKTLSPLAGQAVIANLMPGRFGVIATPGADRIARGEEWLQTNTLDGQKAHDSFVRIGEPSFFQEFGPAGYHVSIGFANPAIINARKAGVCGGTDPNLPGLNCTPGNTLTGKITGQRLSRTPDERLYSSGSHDTFYWTQCFVSFGDPDGEDFAFTKCDADGNFTLTGLPDGDWRVTTFDQWNDQLVDGLSTPVRLGSATSVCPGAGSSQHVCNMGDIASTQWQANVYTRTFMDDNKDGVSQASENGIPFLFVAVRLRDGSLENQLLTDFTGTANFNETFPLFSWYTVETDTTRYKNTGTHVVYDVGGPADGSPSCGVAGYPPCGTSTIGKNLANTAEIVSVPPSLRVPGAVYCAGADCTGKSIQNGPGTSDPPSACTTATTPPYATTCSTTLSSGRIDPPFVGVEGWQGFPGQNSFLEFGKEPYIPGENGGIKGHVIYASTRPFDDPQMLVQTQWEPLVPHVTINLYQEGFASDGITPTLTLVDHTQTSSFDDWAQGFHLAADGVTQIPNMNCPGQGASTGVIPDLFFFSLYDQPNYLNWYNSQHGGPAMTPLPNNSQFKCYDGMHNWNQLQPAPYDGQYKFPSVTSTDPTTGKPNGTNCTICSPDPVAAPDLYSGIPMLPTGKYVVEVVLPPGFELVKEEDKNILIGDNFIAPVTQEFGGLGNVFILPDQAQIGSAYNPNNAQNPTQGFGTSPSNNIVPGFVPEPTWPCVGEARVVPDYISLYPQSKQVSPFAGATRNLCDRKEVTLADQMGAIAKFYIYTSTHIATKFTGGITDDYTSEFDPFSPTFGEKFSPPNLPVSIKDWKGNETNRVYADHWGSYDGMTYSTWEVNPPNPTGYSPTMMVFCMNDPGPIPGPGGSLIKDPLFTEGYSQFCYELPFMPGTTQYLDTPVVPTSAFAGAGYNNVDCAYPTLTPAISEVDGDGVGPWVSVAGNTLTIKALGDQMVPNYGYSGPSATTAPFKAKTITRHYGFGASQGTGSVKIGGVTASVTGWSDTQITVAVPAGVPACGIQQQALYGGSTAQCGQLVITTGTGQQSIDTVTVTIGGKTPTHVPASGTIQSAIDAAAPGDLIIVDPTCNTPTGPTACTTATATTNTTAAHNELLLMWKPVRLQGVGAATSIINANTHPAGKLDTWREEVNCLFGLALNGQPISATNKFDPTGAVSCPGTGWQNYNPTANNPQIDRLPLEATLGWDANLNGNLAELLQEPSLMGALEGAGITVLSKGVFFPSNPFDSTLLAGFPAGTVLFSSANTSTYCTATGTTGTTNPYPSNFWCNPSSIDGLGITNSSQGGGGIFVHGWGHNIQIGNNRITNNSGTLSGGINVGQGEFPPSYMQGSATNAPPGSCESSSVTNAQLPYCHNLNVNVHNNNVSLNSSTGDELFSATPAGAGGVSFCTGSDYYKFNFNWVCGNLSSGDGGGLGHLGFSKNGDIEHNSILFNQSTNPTIPANGGGIIVMGTPDVDPPCGVTTDADCVPPLGTVGPSDGVGPGLVINANLIMGNSAESGSGGGIAFQHVNGAEVVTFPTAPTNWYQVNVTNNIIANNVAGWDGAGVSLLDALNLNFVNNTVISNSTTASAGVLANTIGAPLASTQNGTVCSTNCGTTTPPQPAGLVSIQNSAVLGANLPATIVCPAGHYAGGTATNGTCRTASYPVVANDVFWQNSAYYIGVGALSPAFQQNVVTLFNAFTGTTPANQTSTGACPAGASYWDIGVRGDTGPANHSSTVTLAPTHSVLTDAGDYPGLNNLGSNPTVVGQYCDGSRIPPEACSSGTKGCGWQVPPGISDATVPNPVFNLTPVATVDEGNNWINMRWGPLSMVNPATSTATTNVILGNYALAAGSPAIDAIPATSPTFGIAPSTDFFGNPRPDTPGYIDVGAVEFQAGAVAVLRVSPTSLAFGTSLTAQTLTLSNTGGVAATGITLAFTGPFARATAGGSCTATLGAGASCTINVVFHPTVAGAATGTLTITASVPVVGSPVALSGTGVISGSLNPPTWSATANRGVGVFSAPTLMFVLQNTGNLPLTGILQGTLGGTNPTDWAIIRLFSTCGPAGGGQLLGQTTLAPGTGLGTFCVVTVQFRPLITEPLNSLSATLSVTDAAGTQTSALTGTATGAGLISIAPTSGVRGTTVPVTLTGTNMTVATAVNAGTGVTCTITGTTTATTLTASCVIAPAATLGAHNVTVSTPTGASNAVTFTVRGATLAFAGPSPSLLTGTTTTHSGLITVTNTATGANAGPFTFTAAPTIAKVGTAGGTFSIIIGGTCASGAVLNPGATGNSCTINVQYAPGGSTTTATANVTVTGTGLATATQTSANFTAN